MLRSREVRLVEMPCGTSAGPGSFAWQPLCEQLEHGLSAQKVLTTGIAVPLQPWVHICVLQSGKVLVGRTIQLLLVRAPKAPHLH